jgi:predicted DNA-binding protein with PD1-like motif
VVTRREEVPGALMKYFVFGSTYVIRLETGEKIIEALTELCRLDKIGSGYFSGLGAVSEAEIGHFDPAAKAYTTTRISEPCEIVSLHGNISVLDGNPFVHAHAALGRKDFTLMGGHLREAVVSATCEIWLSSFRDGIGRKKGGESGLDLLDLPPGDE